MNAKQIIQKFHLKPHPEGGYYSETYRSAEFLVNNKGEKRNVTSAIYFLLENQDRSHFHRIKSDELWFFHQGEPLEIVMIQNGQIISIILGNNIEKGEIPQARIPSNIWFASKIKTGMGYSLVSCIVSPGFDFVDFELAQRQKLLQNYPHLKNAVEEFTK